MFHKKRIKGIVLLWVMAIMSCGSFTIAFSQTEGIVDLGKPRIWTATTGHKITAVYAGREGNKVKLLIKDGTEKSILFEQLSKADQQLLDEKTRTDDSGKTTIIPDASQSAGNHAFVEFLADAKHKRLGREEGVKYYQDLIDSLYKQAKEYEFKYPKDFIKEDNSFNMKYLTKVVEKKKPVSKRKNLFTGEYLATPLYANEPQWQMVAQEVRYNLNDDIVNIEQCDTLSFGNNEKIVKFGVTIGKKARNEAKYTASYSEDSKDYYYIVNCWVEQTDNGNLAVTGIRGGGYWDCWLKLYNFDVKKGIFYSLFILIDQEGKIAIKNSDDGSFQFIATGLKSKHPFLYPRSPDYYFDKYSRGFALGRYDLNGTPIPLNHLWEKAEKRKSGEEFFDARPSSKHDDPLNVFAERNIKDK